MRVALWLVVAGCAPRGLTHGVGGTGTSACPVYADASSIAAMRTTSGSSCVTIRNVLVIDRTDSNTAPRAFVQDPGGGDHSAIMAKCDPADANYPCDPAALAAMFELLRGESVSISGRYQYLRTSGFEELTVESLLDEGVMLPIPAPVVLPISELGRDARDTAAWFQKVVTVVDPSDPLVVYDLSAPELSSSLPAGCPRWEGFAMIPSSAQPGAASACNAGVNPAPRTPEDGREILIGRSFYRAFTYDGDCACTTPPKIFVQPGNTLAGTLSGILSFGLKKGAAVGFQELLPTSRAEFPLQ